MYVSDGTELALHDLGGSSDDLLVTHGAGLCAAMLAPMADALGGNYHTVGLDLRGHGSSGRPADRDSRGRASGATSARSSSPRQA